MNEEQKKLMGMRIKQKRLGIGLSQEEMSEKLGMKRTNIANYEAGRVVPPGNVLMAMSQLFKVSTDYILGLSDEEWHESATSDKDISSIQRARKNMSEDDWNRMMQIMKLSFVKAFSEEDDDDEDDF
ncbi:transcriptional regulator [Domibacillus antri]|uniref:Transcriptional regulator n=1 Tax=Domibacillus antri TaxID=1714264 RepID=A0A1Q8Q2A2_9BACI|nr:helix-turn-helix transcriptional regulator [Domibacillus antri]OLN21431.1 transcriptional regulator [Domibacillus antri]